MQWLWNNLENKTKVLIWDDQGRQMYEAGAAGRRLAALPQPEGRKQLPRGRELPPA